MRLGIGFTERETAFDFRCALNDCIRYVDRLLRADQLSSDVASERDGDQVRHYLTSMDREYHPILQAYMMNILINLRVVVRQQRVVIHEEIPDISCQSSPPIFTFPRYSH